ncbi:MAG: type II toxin-antitoxin system RelE/ParE family toxin [Ginsengibacter sp.]
MAKKVIWTERAIRDRKAIFSYWKQRNKSNNYNIKLNRLFEKAVALLAIYPKIGKRTNYSNVRIKIGRNYLIYFKESHDKIYILTIFSSHQDPSKLRF